LSLKNFQICTLRKPNTEALLKKLFVNYRLLLRGIIILILLANGIALNGQTTEEISITATFQNRPLKDFLELLRNDYKVRVFYRDSWAEPYTVTINFQQRSLLQALNLVFSNHDLTFRIFQGNSVFVFPRKFDSGLRYTDDSQVLIIGDPMNSGRYKSATITGRVFNGKIGDPLSGAAVYCPGLKKGTTTDNKGGFVLDLPTGEHMLQFSYMGFQSSYLKIRLIEDGKLDFDLFEESHPIDEITITGQAADLPRSQAGMVRMSSKEIKQLPALMGETDILKGLTLYAGVQSVGELSSGYNVRGGNTDQNLMLVTGSPLFNSSHLFGFLSSINPDVVDGFRLFKGGMPARFGERIASVMEVDLKEGNQEMIRYYGGIGLINSRLTIDGPITKNRKLTFVAGGRSSYSNWILKTIPDLNLSQSKTNFYDVSGNAVFRFNSRNKATLSGYVSNDEFSTSSTSVNRYGNILGNFNLATGFSENLNGNLLLSYSNYSFRLTDYAVNKPLESYYLDNNINYISGGYHINFHPHPLHRLEFGVKGINYSINPGRVEPVEKNTLIQSRLMDSEYGNEWAVYVSDDAGILPFFSICYGLRFSHFGNYGQRIVYLYDESEPRLPEFVTDSLLFSGKRIIKTYSGFEPRISMNYDLNSTSVLKLSYQRTRQYIFQLSNNAVISPAETWKTCDFYLKPLISDQFSLAYEKNSPLKSIVFTAEVYYKKLQNLLEYKNGAQLLMNEHIETSVIPSSGYSWGVELSAQKNTGRLTGYMSYVYSRVMKKTESNFPGENFWKGDFYSSIYDKPHDFSVTSTYNISRRWRISGNFVFISGRPVTLPELKYTFAGEHLIYYSERNKYRMPPYHRADFSITFDENLRVKRMWKGSWTFSVYNLYGRHNPYSVYYRKSDPGAANNFRVYSLYKLSVIGVPVPSLTYNFKF
jgi:hypothetical protein